MREKLSLDKQRKIKKMKKEIKTRLLVTIKNIDTGCDFRLDGIEFVKQSKDWIEVKYNIPENDCYKPYLYERTQYELVSVEMYE